MKEPWKDDEQPVIKQAWSMSVPRQVRNMAGQVELHTENLILGLGEDSKPYVWNAKEQRWQVVDG